MKRQFFKFILAFLILNSTFLISYAQYTYIENPFVFEENKELSRANFTLAESKKDLAVPFLERSNYLLLNGTWKFQHYNTPAERNVNFQEDNFDVNSWNQIPVPSDWQMYGYDYPIYTNWKYPFKPDKPRIPRDFNPVGQYKRSFDLPQNWDLNKEEVLLYFGGVNSAFFVWVNGEYVGYSQDSKLPSEFNITDKLRAENNNISVEVYRYCDGSYLEDQDMWRVSGIERDVYLYKRSSDNFIQDFKVNSTLDEIYKNGILDIEVVATKYRDVSLYLSLFNAQGSLIWQRLETSEIELRGGGHYQFRGLIKNVQPWSAENPNLYTLQITLKKEAEVLQIIEQKVGFKKLEITNGQFLINGKVAEIKGVNRHEHDANWAHCVGYSENALNMEGLRADLQMIKDYGFNAIRTAHYPNHSEFYNICDEIGLYVCDEANIEGHWYMMFKPWDNLAMDKEFKPAILSRIKNMYERDKNHACVMMWSVGNETGTGKTMVEAYKMLKELDPETPVFNERHFFINTIKEKHSDFNGNMYAPMDKVKKIIEKDKERPFIWIEYAHAMGNSTGNFKDLWDFIREEPRVQGGFIWDWRDQGLWKSNENGEKFLAYGGHFEPDGVHHDENFCANGLISADGKAHPGLAEVQSINFPYQFEMINNNQLKITNSGHDYKDEELYYFMSTQKKHGFGYGHFMGGDSQSLPQKDTIIDLKFIEDGLSLLKIEAGVINDITTYKENHGLENSKKLKIGNRQVLLGSKQFIFDLEPHIHGSAYENQFLSLQEKENEFIISTASFSVTISKKGKLNSYVFNGEELIKDFGLNFWRAPTDNDYGNGLQKRASLWREVTLEQEFIKSELVSVNDTQIIIKGYFQLPKNKLATIVYEVKANAELKLDINMELQSKSEIPRVGSYLILTSTQNELKYYGNGPQENYMDRNSSASIMLGTIDTKKQDFPYIRPQEYGNRTDCFYVESGKIKIESLDLYNFSAWSHSLWDIEEYPKKQGKTNLDIPERDYVWLNIDYGQTGVGGDNSWGRETYEKYKLKSGAYSWSYTISPK